MDQRTRGVLDPKSEGFDVDTPDPKIYPVITQGLLNPKIGIL